MLNWLEAEEPIALSIELRTDCPYCHKIFVHETKVQIPTTMMTYRVTCTHCGQEVEVTWDNDYQDGIICSDLSKVPFPSYISVVLFEIE